MEKMCKSPEQKRLLEVFDHVRKYLGIRTQDDFAKFINYGRSSISSALNGKPEYITERLFRTIYVSFPGVFNLNYLLTGEGQLLTAEEDVAKKSVDERMGRNQQIVPPAPPVEVPDSVQELLNCALTISKRNEELVDRLAHAISENRQNEIMLQTVSDQIKTTKAQNDKFMLELKTAVEAVNKFRVTVDNIRSENEALNHRLDKAAELFKRLSSQVEIMLNHPNASYSAPDPKTHSANESL